MDCKTSKHVIDSVILIFSPTNARGRCSRNPSLLRGTALRRSGDANLTNDGRRRGGGTIQNTSQRSWYRSLSANCAGALSETFAGRWIQQGVRNQPQLS